MPTWRSPPFDAGDVVAVQPGPFGEVFLGESKGSAASLIGIAALPMEWQGSRRRQEQVTDQTSSALFESLDDAARFWSV